MGRTDLGVPLLEKGKYLKDRLVLICPVIFQVLKVVLLVLLDHGIF